VTGRLYIVQARPETVRARQSQNTLKATIVTKKGDVVVEGTAIGADAVTGTVRVIEDVADIAKLQEGEILVSDITDRKFPTRLLRLCTCTSRKLFLTSLVLQLIGYQQ
jgi:phosphoenolpyruvate synthase/pyruvate phosphate dikinase